MFPTAIPSDVATEPALVRFATNAPAKIAGQAGRPIRRHAAMAMPVGGQTAVALGLTAASDSPAFAAITYETKSATTAGLIGISVRP